MSTKPISKPSVHPLVQENGDEGRLVSLAQGLSGQELAPIKNVTFSVLSEPRPTYQEQKVMVHLSEDGTPSEPIEEAEIQAAILKLMREPQGLSASDVVILNKDSLKTILVSRTQDDSDLGRSEIQSGQMPGAMPLAPATRTDNPDIEKIQAALCLRGSNIDGIWGAQSRHMLIKYQTEKGLKADGVLSDTLKVDLLDLPASEIGVRCAFPNGLNDRSPTTPINNE